MFLTRSETNPQILKSARNFTAGILKDSGHLRFGLRPVRSLWTEDIEYGVPTFPWREQGRSRPGPMTYALL